MYEFIKENWISLIALIISIIGFFKDNVKEIISHRKTKKENKSAKLTVSYLNQKLIISNKGKANAKNIKIFIDDTEIQNSHNFGVFARQMDFSLLTPNNSFAIKSFFSLNDKKLNFKVRVIWEDDNSKNNESEDVINI